MIKKLKTMAKIVGPIKFTGNVGGVRGYFDKDLNEYFFSSRKRKDPNHNKNAPRSLELNNEFKALSLWSKFIRLKTLDIVYLKNGRLNGQLNAIAKKIQVMDNVGERGYRQIESSKFNYPLIGFNFNHKHPFKTVLQVVPEVTITEDRRLVTLRMKDFRSASSFKWPDPVGYYRVFLLIFELPDLAWDKAWNQYNPFFKSMAVGRKTIVSDWISVNNEPIDFELSAAFDENQLPRDKSTVVVVMGVEFASAFDYGSPYVVKDHGTATVLACL